MKNKIITIDGPAGSGKERIAKFISKKWNFFHLDSGILYRRISYIILKKNINFKDSNQIKDLIKKIKSISPRNNRKLRNEKISKLASKIATIKEIREFININQKIIVKNELKKRGCVIDGRDIGSVVFKKANIKMYVSVNAKIRAKRRHKQLIDIGEKSIYAKILKDIKLRDKKDKTRKNSPLVIPRDSYVIDNSDTFLNTLKQINLVMKKI
mgnify:CR=1 FL=1